MSHVVALALPGTISVSRGPVGNVKNLNSNAANA